MKSAFDSALATITDVVMFENWLRFYFIAEEGEALYLRLPEKAMEQIRKRYGKYYDLAEMLNNAEIDHNTSLKAVCLFVAGGLEGAPIPDSLSKQVFDSPLFHFELQLFNSWVQAHEAHLDASFFEFADWRKMYAQWKQSDEVQKQVRLFAAQEAAFNAETSETIQ